MRAGGVTIALVALVRIEMIFNPLGIRFEVPQPRELRRHRCRGDRASRGLPPRLCHGGQIRLLYGAAKPTASPTSATGPTSGSSGTTTPASRGARCSSSARPMPTPRATCGPSAWPTAGPSPGSSTPRSIPCGGSTQPSRGCSEEVAAGEELHLELTITNPYPYVIAVGEKGLQLTMLWKHGRFRVEEFPIEAHFKIRRTTS